MGLDIHQKKHFQDCWALDLKRKLNLTEVTEITHKGKRQFVLSKISSKDLHFDTILSQETVAKEAKLLADAAGLESKISPNDKSKLRIKFPTEMGELFYFKSYSPPANDSPLGSDQKNTGDHQHEGAAKSPDTDENLTVINAKEVTQKIYDYLIKNGLKFTHNETLGKKDFKMTPPSTVKETAKRLKIRFFTGENPNTDIISVAIEELVSNKYGAESIEEVTEDVPTDERHVVFLFQDLKTKASIQQKKKNVREALSTGFTYGKGKDPLNIALQGLPRDKKAKIKAILAQVFLTILGTGASEKEQIKKGRSKKELPLGDIAKILSKNFVVLKKKDTYIFGSSIGPIKVNPDKLIPSPLEEKQILANLKKFVS